MAKVFERSPRARAFLACALLAAGAAAPATAAQDPGAASAPPAPRHYLWEVSTPKARLYLFGTVHAGRSGFYPLPGPVEDAFAAATTLAVEADITDNEAMRKGAASMLLAPPDSLDRHLPAPLYERLRRQLDRLGMPEPQVARMKPFLAAAMLSHAEWSRAGYDTALGVDLHLLTRARAAGRKVAELEGARGQADLMNSLSPAEGRLAVEGTVLSMERGQARAQIADMVAAWQAGDPEALLVAARRSNDVLPGAAELEEKIIWSRHDALVAKVEAYLLEGRERVFVAVGALHLAGPRGLVELLRKRGYRVRQL